MRVGKRSEATLEKRGCRRKKNGRAALQWWTDAGAHTPFLPTLWYAGSNRKLMVDVSGVHLSKS
jgi:hypothetical protein